MRTVILRFVSSVALACAVAPLAQADVPHLLMDINAQADAINSYPTPLGRLGSSYFFGARTSQTSNPATSALFITDFTAAGTTAIKTFAGTGPSDIAAPQPRFLVAGNRAYFVAAEDVGTYAVWVTDGTAAGTQKVADPDGNGLGGIQMLGLLGNDLIFMQSNGAGGSQLYRTDGSPGGTQALTSFTGSDGPRGEALFVNGKVYFPAGPNSGFDFVHSLWVSDGTPGGTHAIANATNLANRDWKAARLTQLGPSILFIAKHPTAGVELHRLDLANDSVTVLDLNPGGDGVSTETRIAAMNGFALFAGTDQSTQGLELWRTDGTLAGSSRVLDINPGTNTSFPPNPMMLMQRVGDRALFYANDSTGIELWGTDGTAANTAPLTTVPSNVATQFALLAVTGEHAYFSMPIGGVLFGDIIHRVIVTDGTAAGTKTLATGLIRASEVPYLRVAGDDSVAFLKAYMFDPARFQYVAALYKYEPAADRTTNMGLLNTNQTTESMDSAAGRVIFSSYDSSTGNEPYVSDASGTSFTLLKNIALETVNHSSSPSQLLAFNDKLVFMADDGIHGTEPWLSDGTAAGTTLLTDINPSGGSAVDVPYVWNGNLYFFNSGSFMRWDGTAAQVLAQLTPAPQIVGTCTRRTYAALGSKLYFAAADASGDIELWSTDGTPQGTARVVDINPGITSSTPCGLIVLENRMYFSADGGAANGGIELWSSDGTAAGTARVVDLNPGPASALPSLGYIYNDNLYFLGMGASGVAQLWRTDGTAAGTRSLVEGAFLYAGPNATVNGRMLMYQVVSAAPQPARVYLWTSDGTSAGTTQITGVEMPLSAAGTPVVVGNLAYFFAVGASGGLEPWVTDGTQAGTRMLADLNPNGDSTRHWMVNFRGIVMFATTDPIGGSRVWRTDGTAAGTVALGTIGSSASAAVVAGQNLFFAATDPTLGRELYVLRNERPLAGNDSGAASNGASVTLTVLANDSDVDGTIDNATVRIVAAPAHGTATAAANGSITYTPTAGYSGSDSFTYSVADNQGYESSPATVTLSVTAAPGTGNSGGGGGGGGGALDLFELLGLLSCLGVGWRSTRRRRFGSLG